MEGNYDNITNLREPPVVKSKRMSDRIIDEKKHAQKILKVYIPPKCTKLQELNSLDTLALSQIRAIRVAFLLQKKRSILYPKMHCLQTICLGITFQVAKMHCIIRLWETATLFKRKK